jgi:hypothetical protein|tara:strand:- start:1733 stop:1954 length:222 start_codon:yes stop_codon:yes gene_type:complete
MDTNELLDMMGSGESSPTEIHDAIKSLLYQKSAEKVQQVTPAVAAATFGDQQPEVDEPVDTVIDPEPESQEEE